MPVALASHPMSSTDRIIGAVVSIVDISAQRAAAQAREQALVAAENLARARSEFLANMSHEIRTPMNGVLGFAQIGQRNYQQPEKARNAFEKILTSGNQLLGVVNEILDFSKIDAGKLQSRPPKCPSAMRSAAPSNSSPTVPAPRASTCAWRKRADLPPSCVGDPLRMGQVLLNLLTNAVKFTEAGSVTLSAALQGTQLVFRVTDTGIGMSPEELGYVFNPFQQADGSTTRKFGGTGLGLAICKRLVELMQGEIRVESTPGAGSLFEVRLPYVEPAPHPATGHARPVALPDKPLAGISILLAEDDPINQMMLEVNLEEDGAHLVMVGDGGHGSGARDRRRTAGLRHRPDGPADAGDGRLRSDAADPGTGARAADHRPDRPRLRRRPRQVPGGGHGRPYRQADRSAGAGDTGAAGARGKTPGVGAGADVAEGDLRPLRRMVIQLSDRSGYPRCYWRCRQPRRRAWPEQQWNQQPGNGKQETSHQDHNDPATAAFPRHGAPVGAGGDGDQPDSPRLCRLPQRHRDPGSAQDRGRRRRAYP
jgi:anti-sigma regulatory factor (Ser/Thr protein kinase)